MGPDRDTIRNFALKGNRRFWRQQKAFAATAGLLQVGALECDAGNAGGAVPRETRT
jgi:hypothetical protein